jgi:four helix bundle protein
MASYKELKVWKESINLTVLIYRLTLNFPNEERKGLTDQMRRAAVSISSNIAEGYGRQSDKDLSRFLRIALGSSYELDTQLEIAKYLYLMDETAFSDIHLRIDNVQKMLSSLIYRRDKGLDSFEHKT